MQCVTMFKNEKWTAAFEKAPGRGKAKSPEEKEERAPERMK